MSARIRQSRVLTQPHIEAASKLLPSSFQSIAACNSAMSPRYQLVQRIDDLLALLRKGMHNFPQLVRGDRNKLQWMQDHWRAFDGERRIEARQRNLIEVRSFHQGNDDAALVPIENGRLHNHHVRNRIAICATIAMDVELSHLQRRMLVGKGAVLLAKGVPGKDRLL